MELTGVQTRELLRWIRCNDTFWIFLAYIKSDGTQHGTATVADRTERRVLIDGIDEEDRLVQWLNEIIYAAITKGFLFHSGAIELGADATLTATLRGEPEGFAKIRAELKSATYHGLSVTHTDDGYKALVVIDI